MIWEPGYYWVKRWPESKWIIYRVTAHDGELWYDVPGARYMGRIDDLRGVYLAVGPIHPPDHVIVGMGTVDGVLEKIHTKSI